MMSDYGLSFLLDVQRDINLNSDFIELLYRVIGKTVKTRTREPFPIPVMPTADEEGNEPTEEDRQNALRRIDEVTRMNQEIEKINEEVLKIQSKIKVAIRGSLPEGREDVQEVAIMRLCNYRDPNAENSSFDQLRGSLSGRGEPSIQKEEIQDSSNAGATLETFALEEISTKLILVE